MTEERSSYLKQRKRKRRAQLSCNDCRRRKLKCNRESPCNRCINGGIAKSCAYGSGADPGSLGTGKTRQDALHSSPSPVLDDVQPMEDSPGSPIQQKSFGLTKAEQNRIERLECQVATLERQLSSCTDGTEQLSKLRQPAQPEPLSGAGLAPMAGFFKGQEYRTFAYGPTTPTAIVMHFPELRPFMKHVYPGSSLERVQNEIKILEGQARANRPRFRVLSIPYLRSLLPDRPTVDTLIKQYLNTFETSYRVLHVPTFLAKYESFWELQSISDSDLDAVVLAILACVICTSTHERTRHTPDGSIFRSKATVWIRACEAWLKRQSNKNRTLASLQVRILRLVTLQTTCAKTKEYYQEVQSHMGFMRASGMHRDPVILKGRCSAFEGEVRRRLWATSLELELQASIDRGTPSVLSSFEYDCAAPRNINDTELLVNAQQLPTSKDLSEFTDTSFLHFSMHTAPLRIKLCAATNRLHSSLKFEEILAYERELHETLELLPKWSGSQVLQAWTHLELQVRQFLVILHTHRTLQTQFRTRPDFRYSILTCLDTAIKLVELHMQLMDSENYVLCSTRSDYYRAALMICHIAYHASKDSDNIVLRVVQPQFEDVIEKALRLLEERGLRPGRGIKQFWYISAARSIVQIEFQPSHTDILKRQATDRVSSFYYKTLSLQGDPTDQSIPTEIILGDQISSIEVNGALNGNSNPALALDPFPDDGFRLDDCDLMNPSAWMLDDFWFSNDFSPLAFNN